MSEESSPKVQFDQAFSKADQARQQVLDVLAGLSQEDSEWRPTEGEWSIGEVAHHLLLAEERFCQQMVQAIEAGREGQFDRGQVLAERPFPLEDTGDVSKTGRGEAPGPTEPSHGLSVGELFTGLKEARDRTRSSLIPYRERDLSVLWNQHRRFGPMTIYEKIQLMAYHDLKHLSQMTRCLEALGKRA